MRFFILSDLHLGGIYTFEKVSERLKKLCCQIRKDTTIGDSVLFIVLGDLVDRGKEESFEVASKCLNLICDELQDFSVKFEFVPGNHDLEKEQQNLILFDKLISKYGSSNCYEKKSAYSCVYEGVNFIFADSTLSRNHKALGKLDINGIHAEIKKGYSNILFCHHALFQNHGGSHDGIENPEDTFQKLMQMSISMLFHGHVHRADTTNVSKEFSEIGCGSLSADISWDDSLFHQFAVGCIQDGRVVYVERWVDTSDGGSMFAYNRLYPIPQSFADPNTVLKKKYEPVKEYIPRTVSRYEEMIKEPFLSFLQKEKLISLSAAVRKYKRVLLLSDAGMGKTLEMKNLAYELHNKMHTFLFYLKNYSNQEIYDLLPTEYKTLSPNKYLIIFDGYDELDKAHRVEFEKKLRLFTDNYPGAQIVISSRNNFCRVNGKEVYKLPGYEIFVLNKLSTNEINEFLKKNNIESTRFYNIARDKKVSDLLVNPFYLKRIVEIFLIEGELPQKVKLMEKLVELSFDIDDKKASGELVEYYHNLFSQLERIAFSMQLMQQTALNDCKEYQQLFSHNDRDIAKKSSLLNFEEGEWKFQHNNFREYLAARYVAKLSKDQAIGLFSDGVNIKPSWVNTLGYLVGMECNDWLLNWLNKFCPSALVKFEPDRLSTEMKIQVFKNIFCKYEALSLRIEDDLFDEVELAHFIQQKDIIRFLIDKINNYKNIAALANAINLLRLSPALFECKDEVKICLLDCCTKSSDIPGFVRRLCLLAICAHKLNDEETTNSLIGIFSTTEEDYIRLGMYEYIIQSKKQNEYVQFFLEGIKYIGRNRKDGEVRIGNEHFELIHGLKSMSSVNSISQVLAYFSKSKGNSVHGADEVVLELIESASALYNGGQYELLDIIIRYYIEAAKNWNSMVTRSIVRFFINTNKMEKAIVIIASQFFHEPQYMSDLIYSDPNALEYLKYAYEAGELEKVEIFKNYVEWYEKDAIKYSEYAQIIKKKDGVGLIPYKQPINYDAQRLKGRQEWFNALLVPSQREELLVKLLESLGDKNVLAGQLLGIKTDLEHNSALWLLKSAIFRKASEYTKVSEFFQIIDLREFVVETAVDLLKEEPNLIVSQEQKVFLSEQIRELIKNDIFINALTYLEDGYQIKPLVLDTLFLVQYLRYELDEKTLLKLTELPAWTFDDKRDSIKYEFLEERLSLDKIRKQLIENVKNEKVQAEVLRDHFDYLKQKKVVDITDVALEICKAIQGYSSLRRAAWEYLYDINGVDYLAKEVLPLIKDDFLIEIFHSCKEIPSEIMRAQMEKVYRSKPDMQLLANMITLQSKTGINEYIKMVKKSKRPPEKDGIHDGPTAAIESISDPNFLPYLKKLLGVVLHKKFVDIKWRGLKSSLKRAFIACGKKAPQKAFKIIRRYRSKKNLDENNYRYCNYIISEIEYAYKMEMDIPKTLGETKSILHMHERCLS